MPTYEEELEIALALSLEEAQSPAGPVCTIHDPVSNSSISFAEAAKKSPVLNGNGGQKPSTNAKCKKVHNDLTTVELSKSLSQLRTADHLDSLYNGQPEPEDCVLNCDGMAVFKIESPITKADKTKRSRRGRRKKNSSVPKNPVLVKPVVVWFRRDLRLHDNPALMAALELGAPIIPVFLWSLSEETGQNFTLATGGASKYWLHHALFNLNLSLEQSYGSHMVFRENDSCVDELVRLVQETGAGTVLVNAVYEPWLKDRDDLLSETLKKHGVTFTRYHSYCLYEPYSVSTEGVGLRGKD